MIRLEIKWAPWTLEAIHRGNVTTYDKFPCCNTSRHATFDMLHLENVKYHELSLSHKLSCDFIADVPNISMNVQCLCALKVDIGYFYWGVKLGCRFLCNFNLGHCKIVSFFIF